MKIPMRVVIPSMRYVINFSYLLLLGKATLVVLIVNHYVDYLHVTRSSTIASMFLPFREAMVLFY